MSRIDLKVPNIGEFKDVEVIELLISEGQTIKKNEPLITIESDKSSIEIPSTEQGKILKINIKIGDKVSEGDKILELETVKTKETGKIETEKKEKSNNEMVPEINVVDDDKNYKEEQGFKVSDSLRTSASPKVRKFARELGININQVPGNEREGRVTEIDIKNFVFSKKNTTVIKEKKPEKKIPKSILIQNLEKLK